MMRRALRWSFTGLVVLGVALVAARVVLRPFTAPSRSMMPAITPGEMFAASQLVYGLPFDTEPERGDIVVFDVRGQHYVKRVIGLPGETVRLIGGRVHIDGEPLGYERLDPFVEPVTREGGQKCLRQREAGDGSDCIKDAYRETLPNGRSYAVLDADGPGGTFDDTRVFELPEGHYFMLGDNRDNSGDSRTYTVGLVRRESIFGRVEAIIQSPVPGRSLTRAR